MVLLSTMQNCIKILILLVITVLSISKTPEIIMRYLLILMRGRYWEGIHSTVKSMRFAAVIAVEYMLFREIPCIHCHPVDLKHSRAILSKHPSSLPTAEPLYPVGVMYIL